MPDLYPDRFVRTYLKTRHMVLLVELGRHGSIMHAAQAARMTQPTASKLLAELEHVLGVPLFERLPRGVEPTGYGKVLIRRAGASLAEMDAAWQEVMELHGGLRGRVAVGAILTPSTTLVPAAVALLKSRHARVGVSIEVEASKRLVEGLRGGELDIAIGRITDTTAAAELHFEPITDEPHRLFVRAGHPLLGRTGIGLRELGEHPWILPPEGSILRDRIASVFLSQGLDQPPENGDRLGAARDHLPPDGQRHGGADVGRAGPALGRQRPLDDAALRPAAAHGHLRHHHAPPAPADAGGRGDAGCAARGGGGGPAAAARRWHNRLTIHFKERNRDGA